MPLFVTVTPGTTITSNTTLDASTLNLLGTPSVDVTGSVDGGSLTLGANSVSTSAIIDGAVTEAKLASSSVTRDKIAAGEVINAKLATDSVTTIKIQDTAITTAKITNDAVTYDKLQNVSTNNRLLGRASSGAGNVEEITIGTNLSLNGTTLNADSQKFASVVFNGATAITSGIRPVMTPASQIFTVTNHGFSNGQLVWFTASSGLSSSYVNVALYVTVVDSNTFRLSTSQALRAANVYISATGSDTGYLAHWNSSPILSSYNVDGVIKRDAGNGLYSIDFTTNPGDAYYTASTTCRAENASQQFALFPTESYANPSTSSYFSLDVASDSGDRIDSTLVRVAIFQ